MESVFRSRAWFWISVAVLGAVFLGGWEARADEPRVLGLEDMIQMALEASPALREAEQDIMIAKSEWKQAKAGQWAQLDMVGVVGPAQDADLPIVKINKKGVGYIQNRDYDSVNVFGALDFAITQPLYTFGKISNRQDAAAYGLEAQKSSKKKKHNEVVLSVKELYFAYLIARQGKGASADAEAFITDARDRVKRLIQLKARNADESDLYRLESYQAAIKAFQAKAEAGGKVAYTALKQTIGYPREKDFKLDKGELSRDVRPLASQEAYIQKALADRPEFEQLKHGIAARLALVEAAKADLYPSVFAAAVGSLAGAPGRERLDVSYFPDSFNQSDVGGYLGASWHFDLGITRGKIDQARAEYQKLVHTREYAEQNIPMEVAKYYQDAVEARASYEAYDKSAVAARRWIVASFSSFDLGVGTAKDMLDAIDKYGQNQGDYLQSLYSYHVSLARLTYAIGRWQNEDL